MDTQSIIVPAAGMFKTREDVERALTLPIGEIYLGSITWDERMGNKEPTFYADGAGNYWNSIGLKNGGALYYRTHLPHIAQMVRAARRKLIVSISGESADENGELANLIATCAGPQTSIELNIACPNKVTVGGGRMPLIGYAPELVRNHINAITRQHRKLRSLRIKVPPYFDAELMKTIADGIVDAKKTAPLTHVVATNTMGGCLPLNDAGRSHISVGLAGGSGEQLHSLAVGNTTRWRELLPRNVKIIGVGDISTGRHVRNFMKAGASQCQMAGAYYHEGPRALQYVLETM